MKITLGLSGEIIESKISHDFQGIGLIRGEYIFRRHMEYITTDKGYKLLVSYLEDISKKFYPLPVWYRISDLDCEEVKILNGCDDYELVDSIPMMGNRGIRRAQLHPIAFRREVQAVIQVANKFPNIGLIFPFVSEVSEAQWAINEVRMLGFKGNLSCMAEIPSVVIEIDKYISLGFKRIVIGLNDLTAFTMGTNRKSSLQETIPSSILRMIEIVHKATKENNIELAIAGYLSSEHLKIAKKNNIDECIIHYMNIPNLINLNYKVLNEIDLVKNIKYKTWKAIIERRKKNNIIPNDPYGQCQ